MKDYINVVGAGLAGCEAAWQIANRGIKVKLYEMKPKKFSPAHKLDTYAELVCSNSLRANNIENAVGLLKEELRILDSLIIKAADLNKVPAGGALAVDRNKFSEYITKIISEHNCIEIINEEVLEINDEAVTVIATGPLTSEILAKEIKNLVGDEYLYFFDAAAPIITKESIDMNIAFKASRYGKGTDDYINCPMEKDEYVEFWENIKEAELAPMKEFETNKVFEGCMPIETMAKRGIDTMRFGPLKPVGLQSPHTNKEYYAVVQLRQDNDEGSMYNMVGFQTHLKWAEQKRVFSLIPGLRDAEFVRYGVMHRNTFINSPKILNNSYNLINNSKIFFAGQITGVEGYVESTASGLAVGRNAVNVYRGKTCEVFPDETAIGSLGKYISNRSIRKFEPMNINFGIIKKSDINIRKKKDKNEYLANRALGIIKQFI